MAAAAEIIDCLRLINSPRVGAATFYKLTESCGSAAAALETLKSPCPAGWAEQEAERAEKCGIQIILYTDPEYPQALKHTDAAPPLLYVCGQTAFLNTPLSLSIVGARNASINGRKTASRIAYDLSEEKVMIISGMARGIDSAAHKGAMYAQGQKGPTIAVLGTGVDVVYPEENRDLYEQIAEQGAVISEFPLGTLPTSNNFPRRNRIVAALSQATLVVEATAKSGSLITAGLAQEMGRKLLAVPGAPSDARATGPNHLIKAGAVLAENAADILPVLRSLPPGPSMKPQQAKKTRQRDLFITAAKNEFTAEEPVKTKIIDYLNRDGVYVDEIIRASGLDQATISLELLQLEMSGRITRLPGNKVALIK